jgi:hypothetical protein
MSQEGFPDSLSSNVRCPSSVIEVLGIIRCPKFIQLMVGFSADISGKDREIFGFTFTS